MGERARCRADDVERTRRQCRRLALLYGAVGIPDDRQRTKQGAMTRPGPAPDCGSTATYTDPLRVAVDRPVRSNDVCRSELPYTRRERSMMLPEFTLPYHGTYGLPT